MIQAPGNPAPETQRLHPMLLCLLTAVKGTRIWVRLIEMQILVLTLTSCTTLNLIILSQFLISKLGRVVDQPPAACILSETERNRETQQERQRVRANYSIRKTTTTTTKSKIFLPLAWMWVFTARSAAVYRVALPYSCCIHSKTPVAAWNNNEYWTLYYYFFFYAYISMIKFNLYIGHRKRLTISNKKIEQL